MTEKPHTTYRGVELVLVKDTFGDREKDAWGPLGNYPIKGGTMAECMTQIDAVQRQAQIDAGVELWDVGYDTPEYWGKRTAVFRAGDSWGHVVKLQNGGSDPDHFYSRSRGEVAMDTPEVAEAIEKARAAYAKAVEAHEAWKQAWREIPTMPVEEWMTLPDLSE